ncbi:hypothetical protein [Streptomyces sp. NPDC048637]|uniref:hypothetical protein n=1 Tax=Streptomyces sp. NPDC048637 TaxID=3155636 RepID=UPI00343510A8
MVFALWEPPLTELHGEQGAPVRRTATAETADLLTDLAPQDRQGLVGQGGGRLADLAAVGVGGGWLGGGPGEERVSRLASRHQHFECLDHALASHPVDWATWTRER